LRTAIVSYHNTYPFIKAIEQKDIENRIELIKASPADCVKIFKQGLADIALVPIAALLELDQYTVISSTCIGCVGEVYSVAIFSNNPLETCTEMVLDKESRTSNLLAQIMLDKLDISKYISIGKSIKHPIEEIVDKTAYVIIGDNVFGQEHRFKYKYDLGKLWKEKTDLPFVFAVWICRKSLENNHRTYFENVINDIDLTNVPDIKLTPSLSLDIYLNIYISYALDEEKSKAMSLYLKLGKAILKLQNELA
jgi:chorismate dehydratase